MNAKTPQILTVLGVLVVIVAALLLAGGADFLFPRPAPTGSASTSVAQGTGNPAKTAGTPAKTTSTPVKPANTSTATPTPKTLSTVSLILAYTDDTQGYLDPCSA